MWRYGASSGTTGAHQQLQQRRGHRGFMQFLGGGTLKIGCALLGLITVDLIE